MFGNQNKCLLKATRPNLFHENERIIFIHTDLEVNFLFKNWQSNDYNGMTLPLSPTGLLNYTYETNYYSLQYVIWENKIQQNQGTVKEIIDTELVLSKNYK